VVELAKFPMRIENVVEDAAVAGTTPEENVLKISVSAPEEFLPTALLMRDPRASPISTAEPSLNIENPDDATPKALVFTTANTNKLEEAAFGVIVTVKPVTSPERPRDATEALNVSVLVVLATCNTLPGNTGCDEMPSASNPLIVPSPSKISAISNSF
jgi:hypothetical protein